MKKIGIKDKTISEKATNGVKKVKIKNLHGELIGTKTKEKQKRLKKKRFH